MIFTAPEDRFVIDNGSSAMFVCGALAVPPHNVSWTFTNASGVTIPVISTLDSMNSTKYQVNRMNGTMDFGTLTVTNVHYDDRGAYTCNATNSFGFDVASAILTVHSMEVIMYS